METAGVAAWEESSEGSDLWAGQVEVVNLPWAPAAKVDQVDLSGEVGRWADLAVVTEASGVGVQTEVLVAVGELVAHAEAAEATEGAPETAEKLADWAVLRV